MIQKPSERVVFLVCSDWVATYVDGELAFEGHSVDKYDLLESLGVSSKMLEVADDWAEVHGFAKSLDDAMNLVNQQLEPPADYWKRLMGDDE